MRIAKCIIIASMPTVIAPSHPVSNKRFIKASQTKRLRINVIKGYCMKIMNIVVRTVPKKEIVKASENKARFLPTTISPAMYRTTVSTNNDAKNKANVKNKANSSGSPHSHSGFLPALSNNC
ncbi:MAG: hypothetical protein QXN95_04025, partial [Candidatus Bathyarchaeia archaeon]